MGGFALVLVAALGLGLVGVAGGAALRVTRRRRLDRLPLPTDTRLDTLLGHPQGVRARLLARLLPRREPASLAHIHTLRRDPSPRARIAALEALESAATIAALRAALRMLDDPHPGVRRQACRTASAIAPNTAAEFVVRALKDDSWDVRHAAREALVHAGDGAVGPVLPLLEDEDAEVRSLAAMVLQDVGFVDELLTRDARPALLDRVLRAGGRRLRARVVDDAMEGTSPPPVGAGS